MKKLLALFVVAFCFVGGLLAETIIDLSTIRDDMTIYSGTTLTGTLSGDHKLTIEPDATVTLSNAVINGVYDSSCEWAGLTCLGAATITLAGENTVKGFYRGYPGIHIPSGNTLVIKGEGSLTASSGGYAAGIGGGYNLPCGNIDISGGTINSTGSSYAAGIGGGYSQGGKSASCGYISISGANISAEGGMNAAGIGGGYGASSGCQSVSIISGTVRAQGGTDAAGIGDGGSSASCPRVNIYSHIDSVTAISGSSSTPPIKSSGTIDIEEGLLQTQSETTSSKILTITRWDGDLATLTGDATALDGTVIHGELAGNYKISIEEGAAVTLSNANVNANGNLSGAWAGLTCEGDATIILADGSVNSVRGFDSNYPGIYVPSGSTLTILGSGSLTASGNTDAAGIGGGYETECGNIVIEDGTVIAAGGARGAGIGSGNGSTSQPSACGWIEINGGNVTATGGNSAAGIGCGAENSSVFDICIQRGTVSAIGGSYAAGIGSGRYADSKCHCWIEVCSPVTSVIATSGGGRDPIDTDMEDGGITIDGRLNDDQGSPTRTITSPYPSSEWNGNLAELMDHVTVTDGMTLYGTMQDRYKVTIAAGATVTLSNATIEIAGTLGDPDYRYAGLTCEGDATLVLQDANTVCGFHGDCPGIYVPVGYTLTVRGAGSLDARCTANNRGCAAGIGGECNVAGSLHPDCGRIVLAGGTITARGGTNPYNSYDPDVYRHGTGIGPGYGAAWSDVVIEAGITRVVAISGGDGREPIIGDVDVVSGLDDTVSPDGLTRTIEWWNWDGNLGTLTRNAVARDGTVIHGTLAGNYKVSIADDAAVTVSNAVINADSALSGTWAGLTCEGDATIILADGSVNTVYGFYDESTGYGDYPGIYVPVGSTLTINGGGTLNAHGDGAGVRTCQAAGIGGGFEIPCGNIVIAGGTINAYGGNNSAGIGGGYHASCGTISITGGNVTAKNVLLAAGIGSGYNGSCGTITIGSGIVRVVAKSRRMEGQYGEPVGKCLYGASVTVNVDPALTKTEEDYLFYKVWTYEPAASGSYAAWAAANGVLGDWDDADANGVANVFRYAFNKPTGAFTDPVLLSITFNELGKAVVVTPEIVNTDGFTIKILASDNVDGTGSVARYDLVTSGATVINEPTTGKRFFRLEVVTVSE